MYLRMVLRSRPVRRAIADTLKPWRARSRIMTSSPSVTMRTCRPVLSLSMIFAPGQLSCVSQQVDLGDVMIMADLAAARPGEEGLRPVGAGVVIGVLDRVVDPPGVEAGMQGVPRRGLVGVDRRGPVPPGLDEVDCCVLADEHCRQRAAAGSGQRPLPDHHHDLALAALVLGQAPILAVLFPVLRADGAAEAGPVHLDLPTGAA